MPNNEIKISIRNLIEFILRSGDLDNRYGGASRMTEGIRLHQKIQKAGGDAYKSEVALSFTIHSEGFDIILDGRADGIIIDDELVIIDEIKTTSVPLDNIDENTNPLHWAQAMCYAYIYAYNNEIQKLTVQLTYCHLDTEDIKRLTKQFTFNELSQFINDLIEKYLLWAKLAANWNIARDASIKQLSFPFEQYRKGQRELAVAAYKTITGEKKLYVQAPTGIGKTVSTLFPAVKAIGEGHISKIFYLTAKTITRQVAEETCSRMRGTGLKLKAITLTAKEKICFKDEVNCNPEYCEYAKGHFDRVNAAIRDVLENEDNLTRDTIEKYARLHKVCPFEFALDLSLWSDCIICDYNYLFDPRVYLRRFFLNNGGDYAFLIDEAHNLVDRSRDMFSAQLYKTDFLEMKKLIKPIQPQIAKILGKINSHMVELRKQCGESHFLVQKNEPEELCRLLSRFISESDEYLAKSEKSEEQQKLLMLYFNAISFIKIAELYDQRYVTYIENRNNEVSIKLFCLDPSFLISEALKRGKAALFFSATLTPLAYFREILGGSEEDYTMNMPSPFEKENLCLLIADKISTKYRTREFSYDSISEMIYTAVQQKIGNYFVFFPSYQYLYEVYSRFALTYPEIETIVQESTMPEDKREEFLKRFKPDNPELLIGFGVLGGIFSEGIDLTGDRLIGAIIVGVGLPQVSNEQDIIMNYFQNKDGTGFEKAYMFPGMNKVLQAAGRVIRLESDRGMVLLIDERFTKSGYKVLFPEHWRHYRRISDTTELEQSLSDFWSMYKL